MSKIPLSPFLLSPDGELTTEQESGCGPHAPVPGMASMYDLDAAQLFVVGALRAWVAPMMRPGQPHPDWRDLFRLAQVGPGGMIGFDMLMSVLGAEARRLIDVHCCRCPSLGEDETHLLRMLAALQSGESLPALEVLADWLPTEAIGAALRGANRFAAALGEAGLTLRPGPLRATLH